MHPRSRLQVLPGWCTHELVDELVRRGASFLDVAVRLAELNVHYATGGPFGAVIASDRVIGIGVNLVVPTAVPLFHAEAVAILDACTIAATYTLARLDEPVTLYSSSAPCIMCLGAVHWSGLRAVVYAEDVSAAEAIGFDEGPARRAVIEEFESSGISIVKVPSDSRVRELLGRYKAHGRPIYNGWPIAEDGGPE